MDSGVILKTIGKIFMLPKDSNIVSLLRDIIYAENDVIADTLIKTYKQNNTSNEYREYISAAKMISNFRLRPDSDEFVYDRSHRTILLAIREIFLISKRDALDVYINDVLINHIPWKTAFQNVTNKAVFKPPSKYIDIQFIISHISGISKRNKMIEEEEKKLIEENKKNERKIEYIHLLNVIAKIFLLPKESPIVSLLYDIIYGDDDKFIDDLINIYKRKDPQIDDSNQYIIACKMISNFRRRPNYDKFNYDKRYDETILIIRNIFRISNADDLDVYIKTTLVDNKYTTLATIITPSFGSNSEYVKIKRIIEYILNIEQRKKIVEEEKKQNEIIQEEKRLSELYDKNQRVKKESEGAKFAFEKHFEYFINSDYGKKIIPLYEKLFKTKDVLLIFAIYYELHIVGGLTHIPPSIIGEFNKRLNLINTIKIKDKKYQSTTTRDPIMIDELKYMFNIDSDELAKEVENLIFSTTNTIYNRVTTLRALAKKYTTYLNVNGVNDFIEERLKLSN